MNKGLATLLLALGMFTGATARAEWKSFERSQLEAAKADALIQGKKVFLQISAAWCGPCAAVEKYFDDHAVEMKPAFDQYVVVRFEELFFEVNFLSDFMDHEGFDFPNLLLIDPATGKESFVDIDTDAAPSQFTEVLNLFAQGSDLADLFTADYKKRLAAGEHFGFESPTTSFLSLHNALLTTAVSKPATQFASLVKEVRDAALAHPDQFQFSPDWGITTHTNRIYDTVGSRKDFDMAAVKKLDPMAFSDFSGPAGVFYQYVYDFQTQLGHIYRAQGIEAAAKACDALKATADSHYSDRDFYDGGGAATAREIVCTQLNYIAGLKTKEESLARFDAIPVAETDAGAKRSAGLMAMLGEYPRAVEYLEKSRANYAKAYAKSKLLPRIHAAFDVRRAAFEAGKVHPEAR